MVCGRLCSAFIAATALISQVAVAAQDVNHPGVFQITNGPSKSGIQIKTSENVSGPGPKRVPKAYIIELKSEAASLNGRSEGTHARFYKRADEENVAYQVRHEFTDTSLFHGLSIDLAKDEDKGRLEKLPEVLKLWPVFHIPHPAPAGFQGLAEVNSSTDGSPGEGYSTSIIRGENYTIEYNLKMAGVDHLHSAGIKGKGVKVAIIDTGVDYNHPALGGGFGQGKKIAFGRNYVDDGQGGPDDPIATCSSGGHGSHVAGIVGGEDPKDFGFGLLGVAPEATIGMYRIFPCGSGVDNDVVMQAMIDAYNDGADIVSMSLGQQNGFEDADPFGQIVTAAKERGIATVIAAGNDGFLGPMLTSSPAIAKDAIAVASVDGAQYPTTYKMKGNRGGEWRYSSLWPLDGEFTIYADQDYNKSFGCDFNGLQEAVATIQANGWNLSNTFYMARQSSSCNLEIVIVNTQYLGFKGVITWRDQEFPNPFDNDYQGSSPGLFLLSVDNIDGPKLYDAVTADPVGFRATFTDRRFLPVANPSAGYTSNYSTMGNTWESHVFKPLLAAPGHLILSSWPLSAGGYAIISGTSMATPFVAGCYALLKSAFPHLSVDEVTNLLTTTAQPAKYWGDNKVIHSVSHQGAGTINVWNAYNSGTKFQDGVLVIGEGNKSATRNITFTNTLGRSKTFDITHVPAGLMQRTPYADLDPVGYLAHGFPSKPIYATVDFKTPTTVTLGPGETTTVSFVVTPPTGLDPDTVPLFSGYINFVSNRDVYSVPYQGLTYVVNEVPVLERDIIPGTPQLPAMVYINFDTGGQTFVDQDVAFYNTSNNEYVNMVYFARQPSYAFRLDVVAANTSFQPTYYGYNTSNVFETTTPDLPVADDFGGVESFYPIFMFSYIGPIYHILSWWGGLTNDAGEDYLMPQGDYRLLLRILPIEKDPKNAADWVSWLGPVVRITGL